VVPGSREGLSWVFLWSHNNNMRWYIIHHTSYIIHHVSFFHVGLLIGWMEQRTASTLARRRSFHAALASPYRIRFSLLHQRGLNNATILNISNKCRYKFQPFDSPNKAVVKYKQTKKQAETRHNGNSSHELARQTDALASTNFSLHEPKNTKCCATTSSYIHQLSQYIV